MIFADGDDFVFFDGEGVVVSFVGFVVIPIFEKDFDALLDSVFFHGYEINYMLVVKNFLELINKEGFLGEHMKLFSEWLQEAAGIATSNCTNKIPAQTMTPLSMYLPIGADLRTSLKC